MTCRNWLVTFNNPNVDTKEFLETLYNKLNCRYVIGQLEQGDKGTPHI